MMKNKTCAPGCTKMSSKFEMIGRALLGAFFVLAGVGKFMDPAGTAAYMASAGIPLSGLLVWVAALFLVVAGVMLILDKMTPVVAGLLGAFVVLVTLLFHIGDGEMIMFMKNVAILGGLFMVMTGACKGRYCGGEDKQQGKEA